MNITINTFDHDHYTHIYPCLMQFKTSNEVNDIILATSQGGDIINGIVLTANNQLSGFNVGYKVEREFSKKDLEIFTGELVMSNFK